MEARLAQTHLTKKWYKILIYIKNEAIRIILRGVYMEAGLARFQVRFCHAIVFLLKITVHLYI